MNDGKEDIKMFIHKEASRNDKSFIFLQKIFLAPWPYRVVRFVLGAVFIYAGFIKLIDPKAFASVIFQYDLVPDSLLAPVAIGLPAIEFLAGLGLIFNLRGSLPVIFSLLMLFAFVLGYGIFNDLDINCGCFTPAEIADKNSLKYAFYRDLIMIAGVSYIYFYRRQHIRIKTVSNQEERQK